MQQEITVALTRCEKYEQKQIAECIQRHFKLNGGVDKFIRRGDNVLIKPNFITPRSAMHATQTNPMVIIETARLLKDYGAKPFVADSPAWSDAKTCAEKLNLTEPLARLGVPIRELDKPMKIKISEKDTVGISSVALEADIILNMSKFKSHQQLVATFAIKNMFGVVSGKAKALWHFRRGKRHEDFCRLLINIFKYLKPPLTIIDGVYAMDQAGPINGRTRPLGYIISGTEPIAIETVCAKLINLNPMEIPMIRAAKEMGWGCSEFDKIRITGDGFPEKPIADFQLAKAIPLRFSLVHVCKSFAKQMMLLTKSAQRKG